MKEKGVHLRKKAKGKRKTAYSTRCAEKGKARETCKMGEGTIECSIRKLGLLSEEKGKRY